MVMIDNIRSMIIICLLAALSLSVPAISQSPYILNILIMTGLHIILATTNRLILRTGTWFLGHAAFYAIGVYSLLLIRQFIGLNYWVALPLSGLLSGLVALGLGYATARVRGVPFCIITVAFVEVVRLTIMKMGGGRPVKCPPPEAILGFDFSNKIHFYYFIFLLVAITLFILHRIEKSRIGGSIIAIADSESLAESVGINSTRYRVAIMSVGCFFAGIAGAFFAPYVKVVGYTTFTLNASIVILIYVVVGGSKNLWGPVVGAAFLTILPEFLPGRAAIQNIMYAAIVLATLFFLPGGLVTLPQVILQKKTVTLFQTVRQRFGDKSTEHRRHLDNT